MTEPVTMSDPGNLLEVKDLAVRFDLPEGPMEAVRRASFRVRPGSTVALVGESGSGKSVTGQAIMGILPKPASIARGEILFNDPLAPAPIDIAALDRDGARMRALRGGRISVIFQEPMTSLSPLHTVGDQVSEALMLHRPVAKGEAMELTRDMLAMVGFPDPERAVRTYPFELSGGLRQRAMIAMALVCRPALLIADEPTTALDVTIQAQILKLGRDLQAELGMATLLITHDLGVVANVAEEVVVMYHGRVMEAGTLGSIFHNPRHPYLKALMHAVPRFGLGRRERLTPIREIAPPPKGVIHAARPDGAAAAAPLDAPLLEVRGLTKRFTIRKGGWRRRESRSVLAVDEVDFTVYRGECLGLVGESGCGKTTLSKILMRGLTPDAGGVTYHDGTKAVDLLKLGEAELFALRRKLQFIFQDPFASLSPRMTVLDILTEPLVIHGRGDPAERKALAQELMQLVGLDPRHLTRYPHSFSGGQRQRIGIARALALKPDFLICDEPTSALDVSIQAQILNLLKDLKERLGLTYLFISHNLAVVDYIADRIMVMCRGRLVELAPREALFRQPVHPYTKALLAAVPNPDPARPLDFTKLMADRMSDPAGWPAPFRDDGEAPMRLHEIAPGHKVWAGAEADVEGVAA